MDTGLSLFKMIENWFLSQGLSETGAYYLGILLLAFGVVLLAYITNFIAKRILLSIVKVFVKKSQTKWDDVLTERKVFDRLSHIAPALVIYYLANIFPAGQETIERLAIVYIILVGVFVYDSFLNAIVDIYRTYEISKQKPIKGYVQVVKIVTYVFVIIFVIATLMDRSPLVLLSGLGAMTAILMLIFKDSILGLVAGIQLSFNDMVRIGDWIEMPNFGADGDVIDITLNTVKVQNWDKTISTIPAYAMISNSFKNWRGMTESGGRRIKRSLNIDMGSIKFCTEGMIERFKKIQYITDYVEKKKEELTGYNREQNIDSSTLANGRHMTNVGTFRAYIQAYLRNHPKIHKYMTFLIRQLKPTATGLPIEIYVFSNDQDWVNYEGIQADIFDHLLAVASEFELRLFQNPSGSDFKNLGKTVNQ